MNDYTDADAAAEYVASGKYDNQYEDYRHAAVLAAAYTDLRAELARVTAERDRIREALAWAVGFIQCNLPKTSADYPDMRNAQDLADGRSMLGEFNKVSIRAELAEAERDAARQEAADWRTLCSCGYAPAVYLAACIAKADDPDYRQMIWRHYGALLKVPEVSSEVRDAARRLADAAKGGES